MIFASSGILQARDVEKALDGFTRAVQLDPENGEAWNNIACLYVLSPLYFRKFIGQMTCIGLIGCLCLLAIK